FPGFGPRGRRAKADLDAWLKQHGAKERTYIEIKDVRLPSGDILPNRRLERTVYDLSDGRVVKVEARTSSDGPTGQSRTSYFVREVTKPAENDPVVATLRELAKNDGLFAYPKAQSKNL